MPVTMPAVKVCPRLAAPGHDEVWKYYENTSRAHAKVRQNLIVPGWCSVLVQGPNGEECKWLISSNNHQWSS